MNEAIVLAIITLLNGSVVEIQVESMDVCMMMVNAVKKSEPLVELIDNEGKKHKVFYVECHEQRRV